MSRPELRRFFWLMSVLVLASGALLVDCASRESAAVRSPEWLWVKDPVLGYRNRASVTYENKVAGSLNTTGRYGERRTAPANEGQPCVLVAGDSSTYCCEVDDEETTVSWLARLRRDRRFVNLGVRGYSTIQSMRLVDEWLEREPGARVLYVWSATDDQENSRPDLYGRPPCPTIYGEAAFDWGAWTRGDWPWPYSRIAPPLNVTAGLVGHWRARLGARLVVSAFVRSRSFVVPSFVDVDPCHAFGDDEEPYRARLLDGVLDGHYGKLGTRTWARYVAGRLP